jgi:hypothetical protein
MIENGLILTGSDAERLSRALREVKTKVYEESETSLDDTQALDALLSSFRAAETEEREKERRHRYLSPLESILSLARLSVGDVTQTDAKVKRVRAERRMGAFPSPSRFSYSH